MIGDGATSSGNATIVQKADGTSLAKVAPGDYFVSTKAVQIVTVLGSCVAACIRDPFAGVGGMNHFMLPMGDADRADSWGGGASAANRFGNFAMENLINTIIKMGGTRTNFEVKLFGGGKILDISADVGATNVDFAMRYLATENIPITSHDVGHDYARKVLYEPKTGRARMKKLRDVYTGYVVKSEKKMLQNVVATPTEGSIELF